MKNFNYKRTLSKEFKCVLNYNNKQISLIIKV